MWTSWRSPPRTWRSAWEGLPGTATGAWKIIRRAVRTGSSTSTSSQGAFRLSPPEGGDRRPGGAVERQAPDLPRGQKPGDQGYLRPHPEGKGASGHGQAGRRAQPPRPQELRRRLRAARGETKGRPPCRARDAKGIARRPGGSSAGAGWALPNATERYRPPWEPARLPAEAFAVNGGAPTGRTPTGRSPVFPPPGRYQRTTPKRGHRPFGVEKVRPFAVCAPAPLGVTIRSIVEPGAP